MRRLAIWLITFYQKVFFFLPKRCKYFPSCSEYARQAFLKYGFLKAFYLTIGRLLRCNPFSKGGIDPVP